RSDDRDVQRRRPAGALVQALSLLGVGVPAGFGFRRERERRGHRAHQGGDGRLGARLGRYRASRAVIHGPGLMIAPLAPDEMVALWDQGEGRLPAIRALLLAAAGSALTDEEVLALSIEARDRLLLGVHRATFGDALNVTTTCEQCGVALELSLLA